MTKEQVMLEVLTEHSVMWRLPPIIAGERVFALCSCHSRVDYPAHILEELNKKIEEKILDGTYPVAWGVRYASLIGKESSMDRLLDRVSKREAVRMMLSWKSLGVNCELVYQDEGMLWSSWDSKLPNIEAKDKKVHNEV